MSVLEDDLAKGIYNLRLYPFFIFPISIFLVKIKIQPKLYFWANRYIERAGGIGCCFSSYPKRVRQVELNWADKGPRRSGERAYNRSGVMSTSRSPISSPRSPAMVHLGSNPNSFVMNSSYSPYSPAHLHLPF